MTLSHSYMWHDLSICSTHHFHTCDMTHSYVYMTHTHLWHDSFTFIRMHDLSISTTWPIHMCDTTHSYVWHDTSARVAWLIHKQSGGYFYVRLGCGQILGWNRHCQVRRTHTHVFRWFVAVCSSVLQCAAVCCSELTLLGTTHTHTHSLLICSSVRVLQCAAVCCSVLQCVTVCYSVLNRYCRVRHTCTLSFQSYVAACCSVLQRVAVRGINTVR